MFSWGQKRDGESRWRRQLIPSQLHEPVSSARLLFEPPVDAVASCVCTAATHAAPTCVSSRTAGGGSASGGLILHTQSKQRKKKEAGMLLLQLQLFNVAVLRPRTFGHLASAAATHAEQNRWRHVCGNNVPTLITGQWKHCIWLQYKLFWHT